MILNKTTEYVLTILGFMAIRNDAMYSAEYLPAIKYSTSL